MNRSWPWTPAMANGFGPPGWETWGTQSSSLTSPRPARRPPLRVTFCTRRVPTGTWLVWTPKRGTCVGKRIFATSTAGKTAEWAYAESPLLDGDALVCAPGGSAATVIALRKSTGDLIWKCPLPEADDAGFSSAIVVEVGGIREYVRLLTKGLVGIEASTGRFLWRYSKPISKYGANIQTPVASGDYVFCSSTGTGAGVVKLEKAWAYPVVADGRLYIRDNNVLWCYAVGSVK
jgi:outer membrane protein assembly factor BamB